MSKGGVPRYRRGSAQMPVNLGKNKDGGGEIGGQQRRLLKAKRRREASTEPAAIAKKPRDLYLRMKTLKLQEARCRRTSRALDVLEYAAVKTV